MVNSISRSAVQWIAMILLFSGSLAFGQEVTSSKPAPIKALFLGDKGPHRPESRFPELQPQLAPRGIELTYTNDVGKLNLETLKQYDALVLYANIDSITPEQAQALLDYVDQGGGFVPLHCASYCFRNSPEVVALMGAQFKRHGGEVFRVEKTPESSVAMEGILDGFDGFESWDETYVHHLHNEKNRTVLAYRFQKGVDKPEPWTWVRTRGKGRVFYTAWGHDARTWTHPGFHNLVERGIRWAAGKDPKQAADFLSDRPFEVPTMQSLPADAAEFSYLEVGGKIPNYTPSKKWGVQGENFSKMQKPLSPADSMQHITVPEGFHLELFASEPELQGKPIAMNWDHRGRLWVCETLDYPNEIKTSGPGRDRIRICEDTDRDGKADKFTIFADALSVPTTMVFWRGGVLVHNANETLFLKDTDGDDVADTREVILDGWQIFDTHAGVSNFRYGLDHSIWGTQGYNESRPGGDGAESRQKFRQGIFRFEPDSGEVEFIRSTNNNTWGLGFSEEGILFGSTANGCPSVHMPIPNRYYEQVQGWAPSLTLQSIAKSTKFAPMTDKVRQVDWHGSFTAAAGHALYTARNFPESYWNRVAFVNGPTGHLTAAFVLNSRGTVFRSENLFNLVASDDEWSAPIMAEVGPDGQVWVIDWYNYIVQHNPTPKGFKTGKGSAYETDLRDKKYARIYRVVADGTDGKDYPDLENASADQLVAALHHPTMLIRLHAQRLLIERAKTDVVPSLISLIQDRSVDSIGLNVGAIHGLWTLRGLGVIEGGSEAVLDAVYGAMKHPSSGVRRNAILVAPPNSKSAQTLIASGLHRDADFQVRLSCLLALADSKQTTDQIGAALAEVATSPSDMSDQWIADALTSAAAIHSQAFLPAVMQAKDLRPAAIERLKIVANHYGRSAEPAALVKMLLELEDSDPVALGIVINGLQAGFRPTSNAGVKVSADDQRKLVALFTKLPVDSKAKFLGLASQLKLEQFETYAAEIADGYLEQIENEDATVSQRLKAVESLIAFQPNSESVVESLLEMITPQLSPDLASGIIKSMTQVQLDGIGARLIEQTERLTPMLKKDVLTVLLARKSSTVALLEAAKANEISLMDLAADQRQFLLGHPDKKLADIARELLAKGGSLPSPDRAKVIEEYTVQIKSHAGDVARGKLVFEQQCAKCHVYQDLGKQIGPNLTGMAVHPGEELLVHILDPNRDVEANFRSYQVLTIDGILATGMLASESKTSIELVDTEGKTQNLLREDIDELSMSKQSLMPEGFEKQITPPAMADLLAFIKQRQRYVPLPMNKIATVCSTRTMFYGGEGREDKIDLGTWGVREFKGVPFDLIDPQGTSTNNAIVLKGHRGELSDRMPESVMIPCEVKATAIHLLGGVGGWSYPYDSSKTVSLIVRLNYIDGKSENIELKNGVHIADYYGTNHKVAESTKVLEANGRHLRYMSFKPKRNIGLKSIELVAGKDQTAPMTFGITVESDPGQSSH